MLFYPIFILVCAGFQAASGTPISIPNGGPIAVYNLHASSGQIELLEPRGKHYQHKQSHKHFPQPVAPKITFQKGVGVESLEQHLDGLKLKGQKKKAVESYRKVLETWRNPDTTPPPSFAHMRGNKGGERYLKQVLNDHKANSNLAYHHIRRLGLQGKERKAVEKYHRKVVADHMKDIPNAHSAVIKNLAHGKGSVDANIHISAKIKNERGHIIGAKRRGNPRRTDPTHHVYTNKEHPEAGYAGLPSEYKKAIDKKARREGKKPGGA